MFSWPRGWALLGPGPLRVLSNQAAGSLSVVLAAELLGQPLPTVWAPVGDSLGLLCPLHPQVWGQDFRL